VNDICIVCKRSLGEHSWNTRDICNMFIGPDRVLRMTVEQEDAIYAAYLGICVLQTMCRKAGLTMGTERASDLLKEMGEAFPFIGERVGLSALR
jgi:hypothetical protein